MRWQGILSALILESLVILAWDAVTTYTDGTPLASPPRYAVWVRTPGKLATCEAVVGEPRVEIDLPALAWVSVTACEGGGESEPSAELRYERAGVGTVFMFR